MTQRESGRIGKSERETQNRVISLFQKQLGYNYLGDWQERENNSNVELEYLTSNLKNRGYSDTLISRAIDKLLATVQNPQQDLYERNRAVYSLLKYGIPVQEDASSPHQTVKLIDWDNPAANDFSIAEEVTLKQGDSYKRRPDIVIYINGIVVGVIELKNSRVSIGEGIRQLLSNQQEQFNEWFFPTVQYCFAGNDSEGLKYGTIQTPENYFLKWKEDETDNEGYKLDKYLLKMCEKTRFLELMHDFVLFDAGKKKVPRHNQYFGVTKAQKRVGDGQGGIIWHTQGSGKSITMILLARWLLENVADARVVIITDRTKLDKQIRLNFQNTGDDIYRTNSGRDLFDKLQKTSPRLIASLVQKFGRRDVDDIDKFMEGLQSKPFPVHGRLFVFVDECHRTQSGRLHKMMKAMMPNAIFIGFTGTPLLKKDKASSMEVFGSYIDTYKHHEAVEDEVVLDLIYEARDIDQKITAPDQIDKWFEVKTHSLNDWQKNELKKRWATLKEVLSSQSRQNRIVTDIVLDFGLNPRLGSGQGNAMLVARSIFEASRYFDLFQKTSLREKCAIVTSYDPSAGDVSKEDVGANTDTDKEFVYKIYVDLLKGVTANPGKTKTETYEDQVTDKFTKEPANMQLLIVVDKLLTGFDAPACSVLYIDKTMQDHGLFQAICRTNRLDGEDKQFGLIVDYKGLFKKVEKAIAVYTSELDGHGENDDPEIHMQRRLESGRERLEEAREAYSLLKEEIEPPKGDLAFLRYFCGNTESDTDLADRAPLRIEFYKLVANYVRSFANLADDMVGAGFSDDSVRDIKTDIAESVKARDLVRNAARETLDLKPYEADMRFLIDQFILADQPRVLSAFEDVPLVDLIVKTGIAEAIAEKFDEGTTRRAAIAEAIENNIRSTIIKDHLNDPTFFSEMSDLLREVIEFRRENANRYEEYLERIAGLAEHLVNSTVNAGIPASLDTKGKRVLFNNLNNDELLALKVDHTLRYDCPEGFKGSLAKGNMVKQKLLELLGSEEEVERVFAIICNQAEYG